MIEMLCGCFRCSERMCGRGPWEENTAPSFQPVATLPHCVLIRILAASSQLIMDLISAFFCYCVIPFLLFLSSWKRMCSVVICQHAGMFIVHVLLLVPWVNFLKTLEGWYWWLI